MIDLPEDPFEGVKSSSFLRLSNECPKEGIVVQFLSFPPKIVENKTFGDKAEYHWDVAEVSWNGGFQKTLVESSNGFRASLKAACNGTPPTQRFFMIRWKKENISKGRQQKVWTIKEMNSDEANSWANAPIA